MAENNKKKKTNTPKTSIKKQSNTEKTTKKAGTKQVTVNKNDAKAKNNTEKKENNKTSNTKTSTKNTKKTNSKTKKTTKEKIIETVTPEEIVEKKVETITIVNEEETTPKTILGTELPVGKNEEDVKIRKKCYTKDAIVFAIIIPILDLFAMLFFESYEPISIPFLKVDSLALNIAITLLIDFVLIFLLTYLIDFIYVEDAIKKNNK